MITTSAQAAYLHNGAWSTHTPPEHARQGTMAHAILEAHNKGEKDSKALRISFDALASHDITYVGIIQTARASGMTSFPLPYVLTNCHNSLCAVGGTINEDDHIFGLSAAKKYGGDFVPPHMAVIHQYMREMFAGCGKMILGSDSHTRYGALGTMAVGEGGPELVKQLLGHTYDISRPDVVALWLEGSPQPGVGPQDVALAIIKEVFASGFVKNKVMEFVGPGISNLSVDFRMGIDVMTTETTCLSSIWQTDEKVRQWLAVHGREQDYKELKPAADALYDGAVHVDLSRIEPMIALPFHPSNAWTIREFLNNAEDLLRQVEEEATSITGGKMVAPSLRKKLRDGGFYVDQCIVAGCSGGVYENLVRVAEISKGHSFGGNGVDLAVYPASQPQYLELMRQGHAAALMEAGATIKTAFCGPCFGAGDVPANGAFSIRHSTRNFPNREGSKPASGQMSYVALMDARSIAATAINGGRLTPATELAMPETSVDYHFDPTVYANRVYHGAGKADTSVDLVFGPNIADWPPMIALPENLLLTVASAIYDPVTTTDELIPSGETSSYRSNPMKLAEFTLSRKDPEYVGRAKKINTVEQIRRTPGGAKAPEVVALFSRLGIETSPADTGIGSVVFAIKPGDGSAREQAASCQRVLGGCANIAEEYATKRYRSNLVNWGMLPFILDEGKKFALQPDDVVFVKNIRSALISGNDAVSAEIIRNGEKIPITLRLPDMSADERDIILAGCLINYYASA